MPSSDVDDDLSRSVSPDESGGEQEGSDMAELQENQEDGQPRNTTHKAASNSKDPLRPRRKKARRACFACQRAHLTCGDERPCQRCIKRGLQDGCADGYRKKAKYLHDAPTEALMPGIGGPALYNHVNPTRNPMTLQTTDSRPPDGLQVFQTQRSFDSYLPPRSMAPPIIQEGVIREQNYQQSPLSPAYNVPTQQNIQAPSITQPQANAGAVLAQNWNSGIFDPSDPALFNFDLAGINFGNHYGALEFGMLGHMAGAGETSPSDSANQRGSMSQLNGSGQYQLPVGSFSEGSTQHLAYHDTAVSDWQNVYDHPYSQVSDPPHAFAIETNSASFTSPTSSSSSQLDIKFDESPSTSYKTSIVSPTPAGEVHSTPNQQPVPQLQSQQKNLTQVPAPPSKLRNSQLLLNKSVKRARDPSSIYSSVIEPYSYTQGFHVLFAYITERFGNSDKQVAIGRYLAEIRPSFIALTKTLKHVDLIFMEQTFQRSLWEYEGFIEGVGTPTIVARRTGEIAAVGKEFSVLTGWSQDVLLGRKPNLNVNRGSEAVPGSTSGSASRGTGTNTPNGRAAAAPTVLNDDANAPTEARTRVQPVFIAELLDDDGVIEFFEHFAELAFKNSRGSVMGRVKLLKYRTKEDVVAQSLRDQANNGASLARDGNIDLKKENLNRRQQRHQQNGAARPNRPPPKRGGIAHEREMGERLGDRDGKVECAICWSIKRDVFDMPMMIVMSFLPCL